MREVHVYVEGPADKRVMEQLFGGLMAEKAAAGVSIQFLPARTGDRKKTLLTRMPRDAARIIRNKPNAVVAIVPDLYPPNKGFPHKTSVEMRDGAYAIFHEECERIAPGGFDLLKDSFKVFCFKYDLEALLLAYPEGLKNRLGASALRVGWTTPVEDQNHDDPPKRVIERLFLEHGSYYNDVIDAPLILSGCGLRQLAEACPQCFQPLAEFLEAL